MEASRHTHKPNWVMKSRKHVKPLLLCNLISLWGKRQKIFFGSAGGSTRLHGSGGGSTRLHEVHFKLLHSPRIKPCENELCPAHTFHPYWYYPPRVIQYSLSVIRKRNADKTAAGRRAFPSLGKRSLATGIKMWSIYWWFFEETLMMTRCDTLN